MQKFTNNPANPVNPDSDIVLYPFSIINSDIMSPFCFDKYFYHYPANPNSDIFLLSLLDEPDKLAT